MHKHVLTGEPRLWYLRFFANADALQLAQGLRAAFDQTNDIEDAGSPAPK